MIQLLAALLAWLFFAPATHWVYWVGLQAVLAVSISALWHSPWWGICLHGLFLPLVLALSFAKLPAWVYLLAFVLTALLSRNTLLERVPLYRSSRETSVLLAQQIKAGARVLDAGSGDGRLALWLAQARPDIQVTAMENAWGSHWLAWLRWLRAGRPHNFQPCCKSFWREDWGNYDVVYVFLSPAPMPKVWQKFQQQGKAGGLLISNTFEIPGVEPARCLPLSGHLQQALLFWCKDHGTE